MNRNVLIVMVGGFLVAVLVAMVVQATLKSDGKKQQLKEEPKVQIVVAAKPLKAGEVLTADNVKWQDWPEAGVFDGLLLKEGNKKITDIAAGKVRRPMAANEPITKSSLVESKANYLAASMTPGMRAVAISANASSSAGGFIAPGDYVDVILTYRARMNIPGGVDISAQRIIQENVNTRAAETIMQNVKVLAVDQSATRNEDKVKAGKVFTLEVDPQGAQVLALASAVGSLELVLRGLGDDKIQNPPLTAATDARMTRLYDEIVETVNMKRGGGDSGDQRVRIFNGNAVREVRVMP